MNNNQYKPAIVVVAYNRKRALNRLLQSIRESYIPHDTQLIISIDYANNNKDVIEVANKFDWKFGSKEILLIFAPQ